ncbi:MAG TPA: glutamate racemase [Thermomicrobiales bacterium]|nr:glutamate racemase [Thermomicrobiales bacterium]
MNVHPSAPIGVFDSGLGGLSVVEQLRIELPRESILYAADSRFCPYGQRSHDEIQERSRAMTRYLVAHGAKLVIVACNTASAAAIELLRAEFMVPIVALEPAVKPAIALTRTGRIVVLATPSTAASPRLRGLIGRYGAGFDIRPIGVPGLADRIEAGDVDGPAVHALLADRVQSQVADGVDVIVLGCTHYPFVRPVIHELAGPAVRIVDSGNAVARRAREVLMRAGLLAGIAAIPELRIHTSGEPDLVGPIVERMIGGRVPVGLIADDRVRMTA